MRVRVSGNLRALFSFVLFAAARPGSPAENCAGAPFVNTIRTRAIEESADTIVGPQIFDIAQHPRGFMLMGNNFGLLSYDGVAWRLIPLGRASVALSVAVAPNGRIFAGGSHTFGEVVEDPTGQLIYQPFESRLPSASRSFSDIWQTVISPQGVVFFRSRERIISIAGDDVRLFSPVGRFTALGFADGVLYAHDTAAGVVAVHGSTIESVAGGSTFKGANVTALSQGVAGTLLVATQDQGIFEFDLSAGKARALSVAAELKAAEILSIRRIADGRIAVGTLRGGLFILDADGSLRTRLDRDSGLPDNAVLALQTTESGLWAGTSGGVSQLLAPSPIETFSARQGLPGFAESIVRHNNSLFVATSEGVFKLSCGTQAFEPVPGLRKQSFALLSAGPLLAATADGIYEIGDSGTRLVRSGLTRGLTASKNPDRVWAATKTGIALLSRREKSWTAGSAIPVEGLGEDNPTGVEVTSVGEAEDGRVAGALATGRLLVGTPSDTPSGVEISKARLFGERDGIVGGFLEVITLKDGVRIGTPTSVLRLDGEKLVPDKALTDALGGAKGAFRIKNAADGGYWIASAKRPLRFAAGSGSALRAVATALLRIPAGNRILDFLEVSPNEVWVGADDGAYRYDPSNDAASKSSVAARLRGATSNRVDLFSGGTATALETPLPYLASMRFSFSSTSFDDPSRNRYRTRLEGVDPDWSAWSTETRKEYTNLGAGEHRFEVETQDVYGRVGAGGRFTITVLRPWYQKPFAIAGGVAALAGVFALLLNLRTRSLRNRQAELEAIVAQKTSELREASFTDPLTGLRNRRYFAEVIEAEVSLAGRPGAPALHLFLVDLDHFKHVNDTYGHAAGDEILRQTAARLKIAMRTSDLIFRWGGEEFLIVARGAVDLPRKEIANRIVRMIGKDPFNTASGPLSKTSSVGFATYPFFVESPSAVPLDTVIELADLALYRAKQTGRNRAVGVSPQPGSSTGEIWKNRVLETLEKAGVEIEVLEGPEANS